MSAITDALDQCAEGKPWWPTPLLITLHDAQHGLAFRWVARCVRRLLPLAGSPKQEQLVADLDRFDSFAWAPPTIEVVGNLSREIWYRPGRDAAQTAVAKLYEALAVQLSAPDRCHPLALGAPLNNLIFELSYECNWTERSVMLRAIVFDEFRAVAATHDLECLE